MKLRIVYLMLICVPVAVQSQSIHNSTSIFIPNSLTVYINDLDNTRFVMNNGTMDVSGDWNNKGVYQGAGAVVLTGSNQSIDNDNQGVRKLLIDGGGTKSLSGKLIIDGVIELAEGIVSVGTNDTLFIRSGADINGGSASSFVDGGLTIEGTGYKFFPVGRNGSYHPLFLTDINGVNTVTQVAAFNDLEDVQTSVPVNVDRRVYWTRQTVDGSFSGSPVSVPVNINISEEQRIVLVVSNDVDREFDVLENSDIETKSGITFVTSQDRTTKSIIAVGELPGKPVAPAYLSTTLSTGASNPDNQLIKMFGADVRPDNFHLQVVNRWGNIVFESRSLDVMSDEGWNGTYNGQFLPPGAYPYRLSYLDKNGKESTNSGFITILH